MKSNAMRAGLPALFLIGLALITGCSDNTAEPTERLLTLNPANLEFSAWAGLNPNPAQRKVLVRLEGRVDTVWNAWSTGTWLRLGPTGTDTIFVSVISTSLSAGTYHDTVYVQSDDADNTPVALPVTLSVSNRLVASVDSLVYNSLSGGNAPDSQLFEVVDYVGTGVSFSATSAGAWLDLTQLQASAPGSVVVYVDQTGLAAGRYGDSIVITSDDLPGARTVVPVFFNLSSWNTQNLSNPSSFLEEVRIVNEDVAWCSGWLGSSALEPHGMVVRSTDGGANWTKVQDRVDARFGGLATPDDTTCWVVGDSAMMTYTFDGGTTWQNHAGLPIPRTVNLRNIYFVGHRYGWAIGRGGVIIHTADSGATWTPQSSGVSYDLNDLCFLDSQTGWIAGNHGTILATANGGQTWDALPVGDILDIYSVSFVDLSHGWASSAAGKILRTSNGGSSWQIYQTATNGVLHDIHFATVLRGWAVGAEGVIFFTENGGLTWIRQLTPTGQALTGLHFFDENYGLVVGEGGTVLKTANGGY